MSEPVSPAELQELLSSWWFHYDQSAFGELAALLAPELRYSSRSDSEQAEVAELVGADVRGREAAVAWLTEHRGKSPSPLRHYATNVFRTGADGDVTRFSSYMLVTMVVGGRPSPVGGGVVHGAAARGPSGPWLTAVEVVLDTTDSTLPAGETVSSGTGRQR